MRLHKYKGIALGVLIAALVVMGSSFFSRLWKPEEGAVKVQAKPGIIQAQLALAREHASKDWKKIPIKMGLWAVFLTVSFAALRRGQYNARSRKWFYLAAVAFLAAFDLIGLIDPFKVFNTAKLGLAEAVFAALLFGASFFVYRPWCHLACPFGLVGWLFERFSRFRIRIDRATYTPCMACANACPSDAMKAIVLEKPALPDCFSCGTCLDVCPTQSVHFASLRELPQKKA